MTPQQQHTVDYFVQNARETGATIEHVVGADGGLFVIETAGIDRDHEITEWEIEPNGAANLL